MSVALISSSLPPTQPLECSFTVVSAYDLHPISCSSESPIWLIFSTLVFPSLLTSRLFQTWSPCSGLIATDCHSKSWAIWCHSAQLNLIQYPCLYNITWLTSLTTERCLSSMHTRLFYVSHTISLEVCLYAIPTVWDDLLPHWPQKKSLPFEPSPNASISAESSWSLLLWNCHVTWSYSWTINSCPLSFASQHCVPTMPALHKHKQIPRELVSLMMIVPANIVCHRIYSQQVSVMITSEHASRGSRGKGVRRRWVCLLKAYHSVNPAPEIHSYEDIVLSVHHHSQAYPPCWACWE